MTDNRERELEVALRVIQMRTADSVCLVCRNIHDYCVDVLKPKEDEHTTVYEPGIG